MRLILKISYDDTVVTVQNETKSEISSGVTVVTVQNETKSEVSSGDTNVQSDLTSTFWVEKLVTQV